MRQTGVGLIILTATLTVLIGCKQESQPQTPGRLTVAVSISPQAWLVGQIGGEHVEVITLVKPGDSPATYQPSDAQISRLMRASAYFRIGVPFENGRWFEAVRQAKGLEVIDTRKGIKLRMMRTRHEHVHDAHDEHEHEHSPQEHERQHGGKDPHIWLSPRLLETQAETVADALCRLDPTRADEYKMNLALVTKTLRTVDNTISRKLAPIEGKAFLIFHPSWGYFADRYGLEQIAIEVEGKAPSDHDLTELQVEARRHGAKVVFVQPQISDKSAAAVAKAVGGRTEKLDPLAADVPGNLLKAADALVESYR